MTQPLLDTADSLSTMEIFKELILSMFAGGVLGYVAISLMGLLGTAILQPHQRGTFLIGSVLFALTFRLLFLVREDPK